MTLKCSVEPKRRYVAQIAVFEAEPVPFWLRNKMYPQGQESGLRHRAAQKYAEILVSDSRFSLCPAGCVSRYNKQGGAGLRPPLPFYHGRDRRRSALCNNLFFDGSDRFEAQERLCTGQPGADPPPASALVPTFYGTRGLRFYYRICLSVL